MDKAKQYSDFSDEISPMDTKQEPIYIDVIEDSNNLNTYSELINVDPFSESSVNHTAPEEPCSFSASAVSHPLIMNGNSTDHLSEETDALTYSRVCERTPQVTKLVGDTDSDLSSLKSVVFKLEQISEKLASSVTVDQYDQFGKYLATLLRGIPLKHFLSLKQKFINDVIQAKIALTELNVTQSSSASKSQDEVSDYQGHKSQSVLPQRLHGLRATVEASEEGNTSIVGDSMGSSPSKSLSASPFNTSPSLSNENENHMRNENLKILPRNCKKRRQETESSNKHTKKHCNDPKEQKLAFNLVEQFLQAVTLPSRLHAPDHAPQTDNPTRPQDKNWGHYLIRIPPTACKTNPTSLTEGVSETDNEETEHCEGTTQNEVLHPHQKSMESNPPPESRTVTPTCVHKSSLAEDLQVVDNQRIEKNPALDTDKKKASKQVDQLNRMEWALDVTRMEVGDVLDAVSKMFRPDHQRTVLASINMSDKALFEQQFPIKSLETFLQFEESMMKDDKVNLMIDFCQRVGGKSVEDCVRRILVRLMTNEVALHFSWEGRRGKRPLKTLRTVKILEKVLSAAHSKTFDLVAFERKVREWFRQAVTRIHCKGKHVVSEVAKQRLSETIE